MCAFHIVTAVPHQQDTFRFERFQRLRHHLGLGGAGLLIQRAAHNGGKVLGEPKMFQDGPGKGLRLACGHRRPPPGGQKTFQHVRHAVVHPVLKHPVFLEIDLEPPHQGGRLLAADAESRLKLGGQRRPDKPHQFLFRRDRHSLPLQRETNGVQDAGGRIGQRPVQVKKNGIVHTASFCAASFPDADPTFNLTTKQPLSQRRIFLKFIICR